MLTWLTTNAVALGILGTAIGFLWSAYRYSKDHARELQFKEFEAYHRMVKELVAPDPDTKSTWLDRQAAVVFELRHFPRYREFTKRMLKGLKDKWSADPEFEWSRLLNEIDLTLAHIEKQ